MILAIGISVTAGAYGQRRDSDRSTRWPRLTGFLACERRTWAAGYEGRLPVGDLLVGLEGCAPAGEGDDAAGVVDEFLKQHARNELLIGTGLASVPLGKPENRVDLATKRGACVCERPPW